MRRDTTDVGVRVRSIMGPMVARAAAGLQPLRVRFAVPEEGIRTGTEQSAFVQALKTKLM